MAGLGRRSHYRKYVTDAVLNDFPEPKFSEGERIAQVVGSRGGNLLEIYVARPPSTLDGEEDESEENLTNAHDNGSRQPQLALLPTRFRKLIWVKRGDYIIVGGDETTQRQDTGRLSISTEEESEQQGSENIKVRYMVHHILYRDQIKHLKSLSVWPKQFMSPANEEELVQKTVGEQEQDAPKQTSLYDAAPSREATNGGTEEGDEDYYTDDSEEELDDSDLFVNTNRLATLRVEESDADDDSGTEDDC